MTNIEIQAHAFHDCKLGACFFCVFLSNTRTRLLNVLGSGITMETIHASSNMGSAPQHETPTYYPKKKERNMRALPQQA